MGKLHENAISFAISDLISNYLSAILMKKFLKNVKNPNFDVPYLCVFYCGRSIMVGHNCGRAEGGASLALCMEMWVVSAPPCLLLWTHTTVTGTQPQPGTTQARGNGKRRWDGFSGGKVGRDGAKWLFLHEFGAKLELRIGKIVLRSEWCGSFLRRQSCPHILCCTFLPSYNCSVLLCLPIFWAFSCW